MRLFMLVMATTASFAVMAQKKAPKQENPLPFANSITAEDLKKHLYIVASAEMEGRETATEGQRKAAAYIETQFKSIGLLPGNNGSFQMDYPVFQDSLTKAALEVNGQAYEFNKDFTVNLFTGNTSSLMASDVVFAGNGISDSSRNDYAGVDAKGKVVLVFPGGAPGGPVRGGRNVPPVTYGAMSNGAAAILIVQPNITRASTKGFPYLNAFRTSNYPNTYTISEQVAKAILGDDFDASSAAAKAGNAKAKLYKTKLKLELVKGATVLNSSNVLGMIEGTDLKDQFVFITAHYDHEGKKGNDIYYGADDDGSGTVSVIELAEAFMKAKAAGKGPRRSIVFMTVSGEEKGLWGSQYYSENPIFPLDKTTVDLNIDMIGRIDPKRKVGDSTNYVYVVGDDKLSSDLRIISEAANKKYTRLELDYKYNDPKDTERIYYRSDHYNFARKGVPIIFYFNGTHADYHRPTDTPDKINYDLMAKRAKLVFFTAWDMANRNDLLKRDIPLTP